MTDSFALMWNNLSYSREEVNDSLTSCLWKRKCKLEQVIKPMKGVFTSGSLNAILGPSGSGKTTLLKCLTGRVKNNLSGECFIRSAINSSIDMRLGFVPQVDALFEAFTVRETITFACRLNNSSKEWYEHDMQIKLIIDSLGLNDVIDWPINKVSGGERKRTSIAVELISQPLILALDEPTSGLDADNCEKLILMLKKLSRTFTSTSCAISPLIMLTIHSPSYDVFSQFDTIYLLSRDGDNLYQGPPRAISYHFQKFDLTIKKGNPAAHVIDIANGKYGCDKFNSISRQVSNGMNIQSNEFDDHVVTLRKKSQSNSYQQIYLLINRLLIYYFIKVPQVFVRLSEHILTFFLLTFTMVQTIGKDPLCWTSSQDFFNTSLTGDEYLHRVTYKLSFIERIGNFIPMGTYTAVIIIDATFIASIATVLLMIYHWPVSQREIQNSWYSLPSYFIAKVSTDLLIRIFCLTPPALLFFLRSSTPFELERIIPFICILLIDTAIWENFSAALTLGRGCDEKKLLDTIVSVFVYQMMDFAFIDIVVPMHNLSRLSYILKLISPQSNVYSMVMVLLFGLKRCSPIAGQINSIDLSLGKPIDMMNKVFHEINITSYNPSRPAAVFNVDKNYLKSILTHVSDKFGPYKESVDFEHSFVLASMGREDNFDRQLIIAIAWLIVSYLVFWWSLARFHRKSYS